MTCRPNRGSSRSRTISGGSRLQTRQQFEQVEPRLQLAADRRPADPCRLLEHERAQAALGQIARRVFRRPWRARRPPARDAPVLLPRRRQLRALRPGRHAAVPVHPAVALRTPPDPVALRPRDVGELLFLGLAFRRPGDREMGEAMRFWTMSIGDFLDQYFETPVIKAHLAGSGIIGTGLGVYSPGTAYVLLHGLEFAATDLPTTSLAPDGGRRGPGQSCSPSANGCPHPDALAFAGVAAGASSASPGPGPHAARTPAVPGQGGWGQAPTWAASPCGLCMMGKPSCVSSCACCWQRRRCDRGPDRGRPAGRCARPSTSVLGGHVGPRRRAPPHAHVSPRP